MSLVYFDSSALVKLVIEEDGSVLANELWNGCEAALSSRLAFPEVCAALAAAHRNRRLSNEASVKARELWARLWPSINAIELTQAVSDRAGVLARTGALRGADAVHLASAEVLPRSSIVAVWDQRLHAAAGDAGWWLAPAVL